MSALLVGIGATVLAFIGLLWARSRAHARNLDHGTVSTSWLAEQRMAAKDHLSS